jgi:hypothetical protein
MWLGLYGKSVTVHTQRAQLDFTVTGSIEYQGIDLRERDGVGYTYVCLLLLH